MIRKLAIIPVVVLLVAAMFTVTALACDNSFSGILYSANNQIQADINLAEANANNALTDLNSNVNHTNLLLKLGWISKTEAAGRIKNYQADFDNEIDSIAQQLIGDTNNIVSSVLREAAQRHITVSVSYVEVNLAGQVYLIDPLRIVGH